MKKPEEMTEDELREFCKKLCTVYIENATIIASMPIRTPESLMDYSRN